MRLTGVAAVIAAPAALLLTPGRAEAILTFNIFQSGPDVVVQTNGSLQLPASNVFTGQCFFPGDLVGGDASIFSGDCGNLVIDQKTHQIPGTPSFVAGDNFGGTVSRIPVVLQGSTGIFSIAADYQRGT
jgi:hypothetical protein